MSSLRVHNPADDRHCGSCIACCIHLPIPAGVVGPASKPAGLACRHVGALGCRCYAGRPQVCVGFRCTWLEDAAWPATWRPDRSGLLCLREILDGSMPAGLVYEIRSGALETPLAALILAELQRTTAVVAVVNARRQRRRLTGQWMADAA